jgi:acyl-coenzyme A synthetase/AMP-(fatty) acid ligase
MHLSWKIPLSLISLKLLRPGRHWSNRWIHFLKNQQLFPLTDRSPDEIIAFGTTGAIRVDDFFTEAVALSRRLPEHSYAINLFTDRYQYLLGFCAAMIAGQCTLMPPNKLATTLALLGELFPDSYSLGDSTPGDMGISRHMPCSEPSVEFHQSAPEISAKQLCAIAFTSGSTGTPVPNLKYWETLRTGSIGNAELLIGTMRDRLNMLATVPSQHVWGLETSILMPLFANTAISHLAPFYPQDIADALESLPEPRALISSPIHLDALLRSGVPLTNLDRIFSATAPLSEDLASELEVQYDTLVVEIFGCTECGMLASRNTATETLWRLSDLFELVPKNDHILIRARHLPEEVVLPDSVELIGDHQFRWLGRHQDMINIAGNRGSLTDLNRRLAAIPGVIDGVIFIPESSPGRLAALVVAPKLKPADILGELKSQIEPVFLPRPIYMISALPRQDTGKLARKAVLELFEKTRRTRKPSKC